MEYTKTASQKIIESRIKHTILKLPSTVDFLKYDTRLYTLYDTECDHTFNLTSNQISTRLSNDIRLCTTCNPLQNSIEFLKRLLSEHYGVISTTPLIIRHNICNKTSSFHRRQTILERVDKNQEVCTTCNPLRECYDFIDDILPSGYTILAYDGEKYSIGTPCGHQFLSRHGTIKSRIKTNRILCTICNPLQINKKLDLGEDYELIDKNGEKRKYKHTNKDHIFTIHRRTLTLRKKDGHEICTICNPIQKQYSLVELSLLPFLQSIYDGEIWYEGNNKMRHGLFTLDYYFPLLKFGIEFYGNYYHANPSIYKHDDVFRDGKTGAHIWKKDRRKLRLFKNIGIDILVVWEQDWTNNQDDVKQMISSRFPDLT